MPGGDALAGASLRCGKRFASAIQRAIVCTARGEGVCRSGLDPRRLELEITETLLLSRSDETERGLRDLRQLGLKIALDDFGTGYSSLGYLQQFPFDRIKIDRSFVTELATPRRPEPWCGLSSNSAIR